MCIHIYIYIYIYIFIYMSGGIQKGGSEKDAHLSVT